MENTTAKDNIQDWETSFPNTYKMAMDIINGQEVKNGTYTSEAMDDTPWNDTRFFTVKSNRIVSIGQELGREGGVFWRR